MCTTPASGNNDEEDSGNGSSQSTQESAMSLSSQDDVAMNVNSDVEEQPTDLIGTVQSVLYPPNLPTNFGAPLILKFALHRFFTFPADYVHKAFRIGLASLGFFLTADQYLQCYHCKLKIEKTSGGRVYYKHRELSPDCPLMKNEENVDDIPISEVSIYRFEAHRLFTFLNIEWTGPVTQYDLAKQGFYWTGSMDNCRCAFCRLEVRGWEPGDTAANEHRRWNPNCVFMNNQPVGNVPIGQELDGGNGSEQDYAGPVVTTYLINPFARSEMKSYGQIKYMPGVRKIPVESLGVTLIKSAHHPGYITEKTRFDSFTMWPKALSQKPTQLAEAGFVYTGTGDRVLCFQCNGGLKDWAERNTPWEQHARWFPKCPYVLLKKGKKFVEEMNKVFTREVPIQVAIEAFNETIKNKEIEEKQMMLEEKEDQKDEGEKKNQKPPNLPDGSLLCAECGVQEVGVVNLPCGHIVVCIECVEKSDTCCYCKKKRVAYVRTFLQ